MRPTLSKYLQSPLTTNPEAFVSFRVFCLARCLFTNLCEEEAVFQCAYNQTHFAKILQRFSSEREAAFCHVARSALARSRNTSITLLNAAPQKAWIRGPSTAHRLRDASLRMTGGELRSKVTRLPFPTNSKAVPVPVPAKRENNTPISSPRQEPHQSTRTSPLLRTDHRHATTAASGKP